MDPAMAMRPLLLLPEMLTFLGGMAALLSGSFLARDRQWVTRVVAVVALVAAAVAAAVGLAEATQAAMNGLFALDVATGIARLAAIGGTLVVLALASDEIEGSARESETYAMLLFATAGTLVMAGAVDLLVLIVGFLLASIPLYGLIGVGRTAASAEATMKTYLIGALFGNLMLLGVVTLYGVTAGTTYAELTDRLPAAPQDAVVLGFLGVLAGLMFKTGAVPGHYWVPDSSQAAGGAVAAFVTTVPKVGGIVAAYRLVLTLPETVPWTLLVAVLAVASMTLGNLAAYWQQDPRRMLGWSTVSQVGYLLVPVAVAGRSDLALPSLLLYVLGYTVTNLAAFAVSTALPDRRDLDSFRGLARAHPWLSVSLVVALLGLVGTPPTVVFIGKLTTATAAWDGGETWLVVAVFVNTVISLFYYLRWIIPVFSREEPVGVRRYAEFAPAPWSLRTAVVTAAVSLGLGIAAGPLWELVDGPLLR